MSFNGNINLFVLHEKPEECGKYIDDRRLTKAIFSSLVLMSGALRIDLEHDPEKIEDLENQFNVKIYKPFRLKHELAIWIRQSRSNFNWVLQYYKGLLDQTLERNMKKKKQSIESPFRKYEELYSYVAKDIFAMKQNVQTPFVNISLFKEEKNVVVAYRKHMIEMWNNILKLRPETYPLWAGIQNKNFEHLFDNVEE